MRALESLAVALCVCGAVSLEAQVPDLPRGASSRWSISGTHEVVGWFAFDPARVHERLPASYRFVLVGELAASGIPWARTYLAQHDAQAGWGVSFLEVLRADSFVIDDRQPQWSDSAAVALWCARIVPENGPSTAGAATQFLVLEFWVPDSSYASFMRSRGYFADYGAVDMMQHGEAWHGTVRASDFKAETTCTPSGVESGGPAARGQQMLVPPASSGLATVVDIAFAGHRERQCAESAGWSRSGSHPLTDAAAIGSSSLQYGYRMLGGVYPAKAVTPN